MLLLADSGSTKCSWCLLADNQPPLTFTTEGYNPYFLDTPAIAASLRAALPAGLVPGAVRAVHFYGAGVLSPAHAEVVAGALRQVFPAAAAHVAEDLLAAARALLGRRPGFVAILGTGTNSGLYDGEKITQVVESLGYSLGDEGSGTYIGREVLRDYLRGRLPPTWPRCCKRSIIWAKSARCWTACIASRCPTAFWPASPASWACTGRSPTARPWWRRRLKLF
ncbi:MAG: hypothetical protein WKG07_32530 [Hymenobacter sp.]